MRPIIFRGKRLDNGEWETGSLIISMVCGIKQYHIQREGTAGYLYCFAVNPATVGQYTGLKDRAGEMIWEGDILSDGAFTYEVRYEGTGFVTILDGHVYTMDTRPTKIVIGNIHDNPDLLK